MSSHPIQLILGGAFLAFSAFIVIRSLLAPRLIGRSVDRALRDMKAGRQPSARLRRDYRFHITLDSTGFAVTDSRTRDCASHRMAWAEVVRVTAFKQDLFAVDRICLFVSRADDTGIQLDEEMEGWLAFCEALPRFLPRCRAFHDWLWPVATPTFATNQTEIYSHATTEHG
jgi:hypothetical protein